MISLSGVNLSGLQDGHSNSTARITDITGMVCRCRKVETLLLAATVARMGAGIVVAVLLSLSSLTVQLALAVETDVPETEELATPLAPLPKVELDNASPPGLTLIQAEGMALGSHPQIAEAAARVRAARCNCVQVGLPPNPTAGYIATEIGNEGQAGQQGLYVGQQFVRGNKLDLNRAIAYREVIRLEQELAAAQMRVRTQVRTAFVELYLAQREVELTRRLVEVSSQATETVEQLLEAREARRTDLLQAEIEGRRISARLVQSTATLEATWRRLAVAMGQPAMELQKVETDADQLAWPLGWQQSLDRLLARSPQVASAVAEVDRTQAAWRRARAEPIPDLNTQLAVQYDDGTQDTIASVQIGAQLPLWNRNQGGICQAAAEVTAARRRLETIELKLSQKLAVTYQKYESAQARASAYQEGVLQRAEENMTLVGQAFAAGEASFLDLLTVQRTYFESNLDYLNALRDVNKSVQLLNGLMLSNDPS